MKYEIYSDIVVSEDFSVFDFISRDKHGDILKRVAFSKTSEYKVYTLALGDVDEDNKMDIYTVTDNGDRNKVLATVAAIIEAYTQKFPDRWILFEGSTKERNRLYRMAIGINLGDLSMLYDIWAVQGNQQVPFSKSLPASSFLIKRKKN